MVWIATEGAGKLYGLKDDGSLHTGTRLDEGRLSGMVLTDSGQLAVTSRVAEGVYLGSPERGFTYLRGGISEPGHPAWDPSRRRLLVPSEESGEVHVLYLPSAQEGAPKAASGARD